MTVAHDTKRPTIMGIGGSLAPGSTSLLALDVALEAARELGAEVTRVSLAELHLPLYRANGDAPASAASLADAVAGADGLIWSSPLYHGTVSGAFKNALDWLQLLADHDPPFLTDKPVGLIATAGGVQGLQAINTMEFVVRALRGWTVPFVVPIAQARWQFDEAGRARDARLDQQLRTLATEVVRAARRLGPATDDSPSPPARVPAP